MPTAKTLIRLGGCPGWSESSMGAHATLLVLSRDGLNYDLCISRECPVWTVGLLMSTKCPELSWLAWKNQTGHEAMNVFLSPEISKIDLSFLIVCIVLWLLTKVWLTNGEDYCQNSVLSVKCIFPGQILVWARKNNFRKVVALYATYNC